MSFALADLDFLVIDLVFFQFRQSREVAHIRRSDDLLVCRRLFVLSTLPRFLCFQLAQDLHSLDLCLPACESVGCGLQTACREVVLWCARRCHVIGAEDSAALAAAVRDERTPSQNPSQRQGGGVHARAHLAAVQSRPSSRPFACLLQEGDFGG